MEVVYGHIFVPSPPPGPVPGGAPGGTALFAPWRALDKGGGNFVVVLFSFFYSFEHIFTRTDLEAILIE